MSNEALKKYRIEPNNPGGTQRLWCIKKVDGAKILFDTEDEVKNARGYLMEGFDEGAAAERERIIKALALVSRGSKTTLTVGFIMEAIRLQEA